MGFNAKNLVVGNGSELPLTASTSPEEDLNIQELEFILNTLKNADLKGYQIELFYNLVVKIQNKYLKKIK